MRKLVFKFRHFLALLIIVLTISNVTLLPNQNNSSNEVTTCGNGGIWLVIPD